MQNGTTFLAATGTFARRYGAREIEGTDLAAVQAQVPDGWILLNVTNA